MNAPQFITIQCRGHKLIHGFDAQNREIEEVVEGEQWIDKVIATSRIQSVTERYIRMTYSHDRIIYWEYEGGLARIQKALCAAAPLRVRSPESSRQPAQNT